MSLIVHTRAKQTSIRFDWNLRAARVCSLAPPQAPDFVSTLLLAVHETRRRFLAFHHQTTFRQCVANIIRTIVTAYSYCLVTTASTTHTGDALNRFAVFQQLSLCLNDLRAMHQSLRASIAMPPWHSATAVSSPGRRDIPLTFKPSSLPSIQKHPAAELRSPFVLCDICIDAATLG